ncbi:hypothetical protein R5R35_008536 [Gryllus longicercus]|uniref:Uncharacterized protein n=1 Tax=Gryllus longicercus TaxID=2509291 RepID=A0AAN9VNL7_9ORTH
MFAKTQEIDLLSTATTETTFIWKEMEDSVIIIAAACGVSTELLEMLVSSVFQAMIMTVGIEEIRTCRNIERLKRELRACYPLVDRLLECLDTTSRVDLLGLTEVILCHENISLQALLDAYCECLGSLHGCLVARGRTLVATASWWALQPSERKLLALLVAGDGQATARDVPLFLPFTSPAVPFRLVTCALAAGVDVCALCGPSPSLAEAEHTAAQCWRGAVDLLRAAQLCCPRNLAHAVQLDAGIMGILLVDHLNGKFLLSGNQLQSDSKKDVYRLDILCTFYYQGAGMLWKNSGASKAVESYWCSEYHKCHAMQQGNTLLCVLYAAAVPTDTMRHITKQSFKILTTDKQMCW